MTKDTMAIPEHELAHLPANPTMACVSPSTDFSNHSYVTLRTQYINRLPRDVTIVERGGLRYTARSNPSFGEQVFIIRRIISILPSGKEEFMLMLSTVDEHSPGELRVIKKAFENQIRQTTTRNIDLVIDHVITRRDLELRGGSLYYGNTDMVISVQGLLAAPSHPYSSDNFKDTFIAGNASSSAAAHYEIIDNEDSIGPRYLKLVKDIVCVKPIKNPHKASGIHVTTLRKNLMDDVDRSVVTHVYPFSECESLGLYKTREQAESGGDMALERKLRIAELEENIAEIARQNQIDKARAESEKLSYEQELRQAKHAMDTEALRAKDEERVKERLFQEHITRMEQLHEERERLRQEDYERMKREYDQRKMARDDFSNLLKFLPIIIIGIGTLYAAYLKAMSVKEGGK
jgi:hypothetical protein